VMVTFPETVAPLAGVVICVVGGVVSAPVPARLLVWVPALSWTDRVADLDPLAFAVKVTLMVQLKLAASVVPQLFV